VTWAVGSYRLQPPSPFIYRHCSAHLDWNRQAGPFLQVVFTRTTRLLFDSDSIIVELPFDSNSTVLQLLDVTACLFWAAALRPK